MGYDGVINHYTGGQPDIQVLRRSARYTGTETIKVTMVLTVLIVHRIVLFWEPDCCFQDGGQENRREVGTYFITILSVY